MLGIIINKFFDALSIKKIHTHIIYSPVIQKNSIIIDAGANKADFYSEVKSIFGCKI